MSTQGRVPKLWQRVFVTIAAIVAGRDLKENGTKLTELLEGFLVSNRS